MAANDPEHPENARIAQDVEGVPPLRLSGDFHGGRGVSFILPYPCGFAIDGVCRAPEMWDTTQPTNPCPKPRLHAWRRRRSNGWRTNTASESATTGTDHVLELPRTLTDMATGTEVGQIAARTY